MADTLLGIDIGTSSTKGVVTHADGTVLATAQRAHRTDYPQPGFVEHDAEGVWWKDFTAIVAELLARVDGPIRALSVSGIGACTLPADADGNPLRSAILYGIDTRAGAEIDELIERYGAEEIVQRALSRISHQSIGPKLMWLQRHQPEVWERMRQLLMPNSFIIERLTGEYTLDSISASFCIPMFDPRTRRWVDEWTADIAPGLELPRVIEPWEVAGVISERGAELTGLPAGIPVCAGTIDAFVESASVGVRDPGDVMLTYGTTMGIAGIVDEPRPSHALNSTPGVFPGRYIMIGPTATSGALTNWLRAIADDKPFEELIAEAAATPPGASGLVALPYFAGERTPIWDADARGVIAGLTLGHSRAHLYRAMLEATAYSARAIFDALHADGVRTERIVAVGGGTKGGLWTQIVADVTGVPQELSRETIGACYGDALFAARAAGLVDDMDTWAQYAETVEPRPELRERYDRLYAIYEQLYPATVEQVHALAAMQTAEGLVPEGEPAAEAV
jgi:xylulokinase